MQKRVKSRKEQLKKHDIFFLIIALTLPVLQFLIFYVGVNARSVLMAFQETADGVKYTWNSYRTLESALTQLFTDVNYGIIMKNTFSLYFWTQIVMMFLSVVFAYCVWKKVPGWKFFSIVLFLPSVISSTSFVMIMRKIVNGFLPEIFNNPALATLFNPLTTGFSATTVYMCFLSFGSTLVLFLGAMSQIDTSLIEYGQLDGMNAFHEFVYIVFPHIWPTVISMTIIGLSGIFNNSGLLISFFGVSMETKVQTFAVKAYAVVYGKNYVEFPIISAMSLFFTVITVFVSYILRLLMEKYGPSED